MRKITEPIKTVCIVLLVISMLVFWALNMRQHFSPETQTKSAPVLKSDFWIFTDSTNTPSKINANDIYFSPLSVTLVANSNAYTSMGNYELTRTLWKNELPLVKEVFSSAYTSAKADKNEWINALSQNSFILIDFPSPIPYITICAMHNKTDNFCSGDICSVKSLLLYPNSSNIVEALAYDANGDIFRFAPQGDNTSALVYDFNSNNLTAYTVNSGFLAGTFSIFKDNKQKSTLPYHHVITDDTPNLGLLKVENPISILLENAYSSENLSNLALFTDPVIVKLLENFNINPSTAGVYTDASSRLIFITSDARLAVDRNGVIEYSASDADSLQIQTASLLESERTQFSSSEILSAATKFLDMFRGTFIGDDSELILENISFSEDKMYLEFGYYYNLCRVTEKENYVPVMLVFDKNGITEAKITPLSFHAVSGDNTAETDYIKASVNESLALALTPGSVEKFLDFRPVYYYEEYGTSIVPTWGAIAGRE